MNPDMKLIRQMRQGEEDAFDCFVHKYYEDILRYCIYHCADKEEAKDLTQETFLRFFSSLDLYVHKGKAKNYLYTIARNLCSNYYKKERYRTAWLAEKETVYEVPEYDLSTRITIRMCLDRLPEELREVVILYYYQELKQTEIASVLGIGLPLVKYRLKKAKAQLKIMLGTEGQHGY